MMAKSLSESARTTLIYFDVFSYPLTLLELHVFLYGEPPDYREKDRILLLKETVEKLSGIACTEGMYHLQGREAVVLLRKKRFTIAEQKFMRARSATRLIAALPFVQMVAVCNDLSLSNASEESDIDLFIVASHGHIWVVRQFVIGLMMLLGWRPRDDMRKDKICLSFFASDHFLNLEDLAIPTEQGVPDIHFMYWIASFVPLYDRNTFYTNFFRENQWIEQYLPYRRPYITTTRRIVKQGRLVFACKNVLEWCLQRIPWVELCARSWQLKVLPAYLAKDMNKDTRVVLDDRYLKFHPNDRRDFYRAEFIERMRVYGGV